MGFSKRHTIHWRLVGGASASARRRLWLTAACSTTLIALMAQQETRAQSPNVLPSITVEQQQQVTRRKPVRTTRAVRSTRPAAAAAQRQAVQPASASVRAENPQGAVRGYVATRTLTGSKTNTPIQEIPQSISVVGRTQIDDQGAQKVDEALRYTAGVFAQPFGADSDTNWLFIRGFQATATGTYQDGLQLYSYGFGGFYVDSYGLERIEVLRGAASVLYGSSNPGGIVNYVTKRPTGERLRNAEFGATDTGKAFVGFDIGDRLSDELDYRVTGRVIGGRGYTDFEKGFRGFIAPSLTWRPNNQTSFTVLANYTHMDEVHNGGAFLPYTGTVVDAPFGRISRKANFTEPALDSYEREQFSIGYEFKHTLENNWTIGQNFRYGEAHVKESSLYPFGYNGFSLTPTDPNNLLSRISFGHDTRVESVLIDNNLQGKVQFGGFEHSLLFGVDYKSFHMNQVQESIAFPQSATPISATNPIYGAPQLARTPYINQDLLQQQVGVYVQDQIRFGHGWIVTLNGRYDAVDADATGLPTDTFTRRDGKSSGRAGIGYNFANGVTPYASVATLFNPLIGSSLLTGAFAPETGTQYEVGVKYVPTFFDGLFTVALFDLTKQNALTGSGTLTRQFGEVRSRGFEFEAQVNVTRDLKTLASLTLMDIKVLQDDNANWVGKTPYIVPQQQAALGFDYTFNGHQFLNGVSVGGGVRYVGSSYVDELNTLTVPSATVFDAKLGYKYRNVSMNLNVTNMFDKAYVASCQTAYSCAYAEGRRIKLTTNVTW